MVLNGIALLIVLGLTYAWLTRGFFSSFIHLLCVIAAGAIAFAFWEPLAYILLGQDAAGSGAVSGMAWGVALAAPFAASLAILRVIIDKLLPANVVMATAADYAGGAVCGLISSVLTVGVLILALSFNRTGRELMGYQPLEYGGSGSVVRAGGIPGVFDKAAAGFFGYVSSRVFSSSTPLDQYYPDLALAGYSLRMNFEGKARTTLKPEDFRVEGRFVVGEGANLGWQQISTDLWNPNPQTAEDLDRDPWPPGTTLHGFLVRFSAGARERGEGKVVMGPAQIRLITGVPDPVNPNRFSDLDTVFPVAATAQAEAATPGMARFRFDAPETFLASVGGASESLFAFEFPVRPGHQPMALYVRNVRHWVNDGATAQPLKRFTSPMERDSWIMAGMDGKAIPGLAPIAGSSSASTSTKPATGGPGLDATQAIVIEHRTPQGQQAQLPGIVISNRLPFTIQKGTEGGLVIDTENNRNLILDGEVTLSNEVMRNAVGLERPLRIETLAVTGDTVIVQVDVSADQRTSLLGGAAASADRILPPLLMDTLGERYEPIGFHYRDSIKTQVRFTPGQPIRSLSQLPTLSRSRPDQKLTLIFRVNLGRSLRHFTLGPKVIAEFEPAVALTQAQTR
jgi:hypothetical protein